MKTSDRPSICKKFCLHLWKLARTLTRCIMGRASSPPWFQVFHAKFNIRFRRLVLLEMICFREDIWNIRTEVCNTMSIILVVDFCPLVTRTSGGFRLKVAQSSFLYFLRRRFWWFLITTLYHLMRQSWYQKTGEHFGIIFVIQKVTIATLWPAKNTLNFRFKRLYFKNGTVKFFLNIEFW